MHIWNITGCCQITAKWMYQFTHYQQYLVFQNQMSFLYQFAGYELVSKVSSCIFWLLMSLSIISWVLAFGFFHVWVVISYSHFPLGFFSVCVSLCLFSLSPIPTTVDFQAFWYSRFLIFCFTPCTSSLGLSFYFVYDSFCCTRSFYILKSWGN